jgi:Mn-dependent DtxR family transcriptional regulator
MADIEEQVLETMRAEGKPLSAGELAEIMGVEKPQVSKAINGLKKQGRVNSPKRCYYAPTD